jgi:mycoredoxin
MSKNTALLLLICLAGGVFQNRDRIERWLHPAPPRQSGSESVVLYAATWCGYCTKTREYFVRNHIAFEELDVENSTEGRQGYEQLGGGGIPIVVVDNRTVIRGYRPEAIADALRQ